MKNKLIICIFCCFFSVHAYTQQQGFLENVYKFIEDPGKFVLNQETGHIPLVPFASVQEALENDWNKSGGFFHRKIQRLQLG